MISGESVGKLQAKLEITLLDINLRPRSYQILCHADILSARKPN